MNLKIIVPQSNKFYDIYNFITAGNDGNFTEDQFNQYTEYCNKLWEQAQGDTNNSSLNQRTKTLIKELLENLAKYIILGNEQQQYTLKKIKAVDQHPVTGTTGFDIDGNISIKGDQIEDKLTMDDLGLSFE